MKRLKEIRLAANVAAKDAAEIVGVLYRTYQKYENGEIDPPLSKVITLADFFNVSLDYLVGRSDVAERR